MIKILVVTFLLLFWIIQTTYSQPSTKLSGSVERVVDGDTFYLRNSGGLDKIRLYAADAPEKSQEHGKQATQALQALLSAQKVDADCYKTDKHHRSVCRVYVNGKDVSLALVAAGHAWYATRFAKEFTASERDAFAIAQTRAQTARQGLWSNPSPTPPWDKRKEH